jgi:hypothetical protein
MKGYDPFEAAYEYLAAKFSRISVQIGLIVG